MSKLVPQSPNKRLNERYSGSVLLYLVISARVKDQIHGAILCEMAKLQRVSAPEIVALNFAAVEFRAVSATLRTTNSLVYPPSATFRAIV